MKNRATTAPPGSIQQPPAPRPHKAITSTNPRTTKTTRFGSRQQPLRPALPWTHSACTTQIHIRRPEHKRQLLSSPAPRRQQQHTAPNCGAYGSAHAHAGARRATTTPGCSSLATPSSPTLQYDMTVRPERRLSGEDRRRRAPRDRSPRMETSICSSPHHTQPPPRPKPNAGPSEPRAELVTDGGARNQNQCFK